MRALRWRRLAATVVVVGTLGGCTTPADDADPTPSPTATTAAPATSVDLGYRIAVVIGPPTLVAAGEAAVLEATAKGLLAAEDHALVDGVSDVRVLRATTAAFAGDLLHLAADDGYDLVCLVGTGTGRLLVTVARERRATRFCGTDASVEAPPANVAVVGLDPAALLAAAAAAVGDAPSPVGVIADTTLGEQSAVAEALLATIPAARVEPVPSPASTESTAPASSPSDPPAAASGDTLAGDVREGAPSEPAPAVAGTTEEPSDGGSPAPTTPIAGVAAEGPEPDRVVVVGTGQGALPVASAVEQLVALRPSVAVVLPATGSGDAARALGEAGTSVVLVGTWAVDAEGQLPGQLLVALTVDWPALLRAAIAAGRDPASSPTATLGLADGLLGVLPGSAAGAAAAVGRVEALLATSREE